MKPGDCVISPWMRTFEADGQSHRLYAAGERGNRNFCDLRREERDRALPQRSSVERFVRTNPDGSHQLGGGVEDLLLVEGECLVELVGPEQQPRHGAREARWAYRLGPRAGMMFRTGRGR